ncbi:hypothetical protein PVAP13_9NG660632 [Panicum virgatum]|uniref:Uncharacterized protein n=1 Tax=Panicum virgatum TaxID=38727 RepID=A0A8T0N1F6_PANVG|nr:hypothetical protein PVAP13_9NG660632 [Panicum virgatum]
MHNYNGPQRRRQRHSGRRYIAFPHVYYCHTTTYTNTSDHFPSFLHTGPRDFLWLRCADRRRQVAASQHQKRRRKTRSNRRRQSSMALYGSRLGG